MLQLCGDLNKYLNLFLKCQHISVPSGQFCTPDLEPPHINCYVSQHDIQLLKFQCIITYCFNLQIWAISACDIYA